jgi:hypothetical protein
MNAPMARPSGIALRVIRRRMNSLIRDRDLSTLRQIHDPRLPGRLSLKSHLCINTRDELGKSVNL